MITKNLYKKMVVVLLTGTTTIFLFSCRKDNPQPATNTTQQLPAVVSFSVNIVPIFNTEGCNISGTCHGGTSPAAGLNLTAAVAYNSLIAKQEIYTANPSGSNLYIEVTNGEMPPPPATISSYDQQLILKWIQQGADNN